jgi:hypothetical protein
LANSTLLSLFQTTLQGMGVAFFGQPSTVIGNTNQDVVQTLALVNTAGGSLNREHGWQYSQIQYNFEATYFDYTGTSTSGSASLTSMSSIASLDTTFMVEGTGIPNDTFISAAPTGTTVVMNREATASGSATFTFSKVRFAVPSDFDRMVDRSQWDKDTFWEMFGPMTTQQQAFIRSGLVATAPRIRFWQQQGFFQIWPPLGEDENLAYWYQSKYWILATAATAVSKELFTADTDTCIFPDPLMRSLIKLKYLEAKGLWVGSEDETGSPAWEYWKQINLAKAHEAGSPTLSMRPRPAGTLIGMENIQDGNYPS